MLPNDQSTGSAAIRGFAIQLFDRNKLVDYRRQRERKRNGKERIAG
ncbi:hypothetical protein [Paenibacillus dendritiformis]|nr:hypothetical protein [Paenibacillus dendritiformis]CAH8769577.1 hypothetical protein H7S4_002308 [Paenibacillus dendritiformis]